MSKQLSGNAVNELACLLVPVVGKNLIMPNVSVAEIVGYLHPVADADTPQWLLGMISWRNQQVPLISFDALNGQHLPESKVENRLAILNSTGISQDLPWIAIVTQSTPRLMRVGAEEIAEIPGMELGPFEQMAVSVNGEEAFIPDLNKLQQEFINFKDT